MAITTLLCTLQTLRKVKVPTGLYNNRGPFTARSPAGGVITIGSEAGDPIHFSSLLPWCATLVSINRDLVFDYFN